MNLYAVGCSFTHGHGALPGPANVCKHGDFVVNTHGKFDYAWPWQLEPHFDTVINDGYQGSGNDYVLRRTLRMLAHLDPAEISDWVFVIQLSVPQRKEFLDSASNMFYQVLYHEMFDHLQEGSDQPLKYKNFAEFTAYETHNTQLTDQQKHYAAGFYYHCWHEEFILYEHFRDLLLMTEILENKKCKYLITGMCSMDFVPEHILLNYNLKNRYTVNYINLLKTHNQLIGISELLHKLDPSQSNLIAPCGHPNELGHQAVAEYILDEIKQRGWL